MPFVTRSTAMFVLSMCACGTSQTATPGSAEPPTEAVATAEATPASTSEAEASEPAGAAAAQADDLPQLEPALIEVARGTDTAHEIELVVDAKGRIVKQAVYHRNEQAVPKAVLELAKKKFPGAKIDSYEIEKYPEGIVHEVEVHKKDGTDCEVAVREDGTEVYVECHLQKSKLPKPVAAKLEELYPKGKIEEVETKKGPGIDLVTVEITEGGREYYLHFAPDGTLKKRYRKIPADVELEID